MKAVKETTQMNIHEKFQEIQRTPKILVHVVEIVTEDKLEIPNSFSLFENTRQISNFNKKHFKVSRRYEENQPDDRLDKQPNV